MKEFEVTCINKPDRTNAHEHITHIGNVAGQWRITRELAIKKIDRTQWPNLYRLAERFGVTITALRVRLEQFNLVYLDQETKRLYPSRQDAQGQAGLLF